MKLNEFVETYKKFIKQDPPIKDEEVEKWLGQQEQYGVNIPNFEGLWEDYNNKWIKYVNQNCNDHKQKKVLVDNKVEDILLNASEISSALRYINYAHHLTKPEIFDDDFEL